jgi:long-chain acyl-CoA synthetase
MQIPPGDAFAESLSCGSQLVNQGPPLDIANPAEVPYSLCGTLYQPPRVMTSGSSAEHRPRTLNDIFFRAVNRRHDRLMLVRGAIDWVPISSDEFHHNVLGFAGALQQWGIIKGDRVAILSENRPEWAVTDFATLLLGGVVVPIYATLTDRQTLQLLCDCQARVVVVSTQEQLNKILAIRDQSPIERVVVMDAVETAHAAHMQRLIRDGSGAFSADLENRARSVQPDDLATIIYTSGTTGNSKGAALTHGNMTSNICCSLEGFKMQPGDVSVSFLPLSHVTARHVDFALLYHGVTLAYCPFITQLPQALLEVRPTIIVAVPRVYEKIHWQVENETKAFPKSDIYRWALSIGRAAKPEILAGQTPSSHSWKLANKLVFSKVRAGLGGRARIFISGGAPLGRELADWYATIGIRIHEGYGLTETSPVIAVNTPTAHKLGTVGKPLANVEVRIADDGEILVRGPSVFHGYWNKPEETASVFVDGWFKTGDIGALDADGFLSVTDRKKDLIKTSGGKFIAPQPIENSLKLNALVGAAIVLGDKRKFPAVIISPCFPLLEDWARNNNVPVNSRHELIAQPAICALYEGIVEDMNNNLARFEKLKRVILVPDDFSPESGLLTPTLKLRRRAVEERYRPLIEKLYADAEK